MSLRLPEPGSFEDLRRRKLVGSTRPEADGGDGQLPVIRLPPNRGEQGVVDGFEQARPLVHDLRQPRPAHRDAGIAQALVLAVQGQVVGELVDQHSSYEADLGAGEERRVVTGYGRAAYPRSGD